MRTESSRNQDVLETTLLAVVKGVAEELHPGQIAMQDVGLDSVLDRDLGIDSLGRVELLARLEKTTGVALSEQVFVNAETPRDLLRAVLSGTQIIPARVSEVSVTATTKSSLQTPDDVSTLVEMLDWHVQAHPDQPHIHLYRDDGDGPVITYRDLHTNALRIASGLQQHDILPGETVAIMLPTGTDYFYSFFGILLAGCIPVPIYPPARRSQIENHLRRQEKILNNCRASTLITVAEAIPIAHLVSGRVESLRHVLTADTLIGSNAVLNSPVLNEHDIALLQYTSGSTGDPKGVILSHANLLANIRADGRAIQARPDDVFVSWLPLYHDMGLIGAWLGSLYHGVQLVIMSPLEFLSRPKRWLWAIHRYRGTLSASPNFGYELCLKGIDEQDLEGLDLSSWRVAFNGAEPVLPNTIENFIRNFSAHGFRATAMYPVYGMAECALGATFPPAGREPRIDRIQRQALSRKQRAIPAPDDENRPLSFVCSGRSLPGHQLRIVDSTGEEVPERREGRIQLKGPSVTSGYYRNPDASRELFQGDWMNTGDLGYVANGELFVTGRAKDVIIRAGRNIYPHELEESLGNVSGIRKGCVAVFGSEDPSSGTERLIILAETRARKQETLRTLERHIYSIVTDLTDTPPDDVVLAPPNSVLKTSSGKIRRAACRTLYEKQLLGKRTPAIWWQVTRLALTGIYPRLRRISRLVTSRIYAVYAQSMFRGFAGAVWLGVLLTPNKYRRWSFMRGAARNLGRLTGVRLSVHGLENLPTEDRPFILVANHASFIDAYVLVAALPYPVRFLAKAELGGTFISRSFLDRLDTVYTERFDRQKGIEDARGLTDAAALAPALAIFPEGTFTNIPGVYAFRMGAFMAAAEAGIPVVPVAIRGTRSILRGKAWIPYPGSVTLTFGKPVEPNDMGQAPETSPWQTALALRDAARAHILRHCGEPDQGEERNPLDERDHDNPDR